MKSIVILVSLLALICLSNAQKPRPLISPGKSLTGQNAQGYCNVEFYRGNTLAYTASTDHYNTRVTRSSFSSTNDNKITKINYYGTRCFLWIVIFKNKTYGGPNIAFWTQSTSGSFDLTFYHSYDQSTSAWFNWSKAVSSYTVYYY